MVTGRSRLRVGGALAALCAAVSSAGCGTLTPRWPVRGRADVASAAISPDDPAQAPPQSDVPAGQSAQDAQGSPSPETPTGSSPTVEQPSVLPAQLLAALGAPGWFLATARPDQPPPKHTWRHVGVEELLARDDLDRTALVAAAQGDTPAAVGAAVALARSGGNAGAETLAVAVRNFRLPLATRRAAAEALSELTGEAETAALAELCDDMETAAHEGAALYAVELHADLIDRLGRRSAASHEARLRAALRSNAPEVRKAALNCYTIAGAAPLPTEAVELRSDPYPAVRSRALEAIAARPPAEALDMLSAALGDQDLIVREAAALGLGRLGDRRSAARLKAILEDPSEKMRAAALTALARLGDEAAILAAVENSSWLARATAADALAALPTPQASRALERLVNDPSGYVRQHALTSLEQWPLEQAGPLLIEALGHAGYQTRRQAAAELARRWPAARNFSVDAPAERRNQMVAELSAAWQTQYGRVNRAALASAVVEASDPAASLDAQTAADLAQQLLAPPADAEELVGRLRGLSARQWQSVDAALRQSGALLPAATFERVLPQVDPLYEQLERLRTGAVDIRRGAAAQISKRLNEQRPPLVAVQRLADLLRGETDEQVWRSSLTAVAGDGRPPAVDLAAFALAQASADVRRRGCEILERFGQPQHAAALTAALGDRHAAVAAAAAQALGRPGMLADPAPLAALLGAADRSVRIAAARSLARGGWPQGADALERLCYDADPKIRVRVAEALGQCGGESSLACLMRLLDDPVSDVRLAALGQLPQAAGVDAAQPPGTPGVATAQERTHRWKQWWAERQVGGSQPHESRID